MKNIVKFTIYIIILSLILHKLYKITANSSGNKTKLLILVSNTPYDCMFEKGGYFIKLPDCGSYKPGTVLEIVGFFESNFSRDGILLDTGFFEKKRLIAESIRVIEDIGSSPEVWLEYLFYLFKSKKLVLLGEFLPFFNIDDAYLIGRLGFGFSQVRSRSLDHLFKVTGTQYLASISGFHLNLIIRLITNTIRKYLGKKQISIIVLLVSSFYLLLIGHKIPLVRAFLMLILSVVSTSFLLRQNNSMHALFLIAIILIYIDITVISSVSFQLSFIATASIIFFISTFKNSKNNKLAHLHTSNFINNKEEKTEVSSIINSIKKYAIDSIKISIYVQAALLPLVIYHFNEFSIISLIAAVALTWLVPGIILLGFISIFVSLLGVNEAIIKLLILPLSFFTNLFLSIIRLFDNQSFLIKIDYFPWWYVFIWWITVIFFLKLINKNKKIPNLVKIL